MDRVIPKSIQKKKQRKKWLGIGAVLLTTVGIFWVFRSVLTAELSKSKLRIATVEVGNIEETLTASGEVTPEFEQIIVSPIQAQIESIFLPAGSVVDAEQSILKLNKEFALIQREKLFNEWKLAKNTLAKLKFQLERDLLDIDTKLSIQRLRLEQLKKKLDDTQGLVKIGGKTQKEAEQAKLDWEIAQLEVNQLKNDLVSKKGSMNADLSAQQIRVSIIKESLNELDKKLKQAGVFPNRKGIVTWVNEQIGSTVQPNQEVARVADLSSFRVIGSISSVHADKVSSGQKTIVKVNDKELRGAIVNIQPEVVNNTLKFTIALDNKSDISLRPNMKVQVYVVIGSAKNTLKVANGPIFSGKGYENLFVLNEGRLEKRSVKIGLTNFDEIELLGNVKAGEQIVLSKLKEYEHLDHIELTD